MAVTAWNLLMALVPLTLQPDRFDSFSHQFGPIFLLFLPAALLERPPRRVLGLAALGYLFLMLCLTQRQSMRFVLIALGPMAIAVAHGACAWCDRKTVPARLMVAVLLAALGLEAAWAVARSRHVLGLVAGRESAESLLARREPTYVVGRWAGAKPARDGASDRPGPSGLLHPAPLHDGAGPPPPDRAWAAAASRPAEIVERLRASGFTHVMFCPPVPETAVEFDPTLGRLLAPWLAGRTPIYREDLTDGDGVLRRYAIYELSTDRLASRPMEGPHDDDHDERPPEPADARRAEGRVQKGRHREIGNWLARRVARPSGRLRMLAGRPAGPLGAPGDRGGLAVIAGGGGGHRHGRPIDVRPGRRAGAPGLLARPCRRPGRALARDGEPGWGLPRLPDASRGEPGAGLRAGIWPGGPIGRPSLDDRRVRDRRRLDDA